MTLFDSTGILVAGFVTCYLFFGAAEVVYNVCAAVLGTDSE